MLFDKWVSPYIQNRYRIMTHKYIISKPLLPWPGGCSSFPQLVSGEDEAVTTTEPVGVTCYIYITTAFVTVALPVTRFVVTTAFVTVPLHVTKSVVTAS